MLEKRELACTDLPAFEYVDASATFPNAKTVRVARSKREKTLKMPKIPGSACSARTSCYVLFALGFVFLAFVGLTKVINEHSNCVQVFKETPEADVANLTNLSLFSTLNAAFCPSLPPPELICRQEFESIEKHIFAMFNPSVQDLVKLKLTCDAATIFKYARKRRDDARQLFLDFHNKIPHCFHKIADSHVCDPKRKKAAMVAFSKFLF
ncbi:hypothetical protein L596_018263 [Steinernema carpocapsae]|uniref:Uncharacterized protein n=1 Tax=Steinernema carpocapsae TaxID=34508 RepID=A0A4V6A1Z3_STECR|nr:hypothetical protein L596_018263 [Steinernema carpocapsae]